MDGVELKDEPTETSGDDLKNRLDLNKCRFVELKTSRFIETDRQETNFWRFKARKWWCQSFLVGIPKIICGFRDDDGVVGELRDYDVQQIPKNAGPGLWKPNVCINFLNVSELASLLLHT